MFSRLLPQIIFREKKNPEQLLVCLNLYMGLFYKIMFWQAHKK